MSFLSLYFLTALPLVAAPLVLHLFDRRRNVVVEWGAMQFLLEAATRRTSARRFKQWLLLLLRMLTVLALVCALARPLVPGNWFGTDQRVETILILDNSLSMSRRLPDQSLFEAATARGGELIAAAAAGDAFRILTSSPYPEDVTAGSVRIDSGSRKLLIRQLQEQRPTAGRSDLLAALFTAVQSERDPLLQQRRIVILTDGQGTDWRLTDDAGWDRFLQTLKSSATPTQLEIVRLGAGLPVSGNLAVDEILTSRIVVGPGQPIKFAAIVRNHGSAMTNECVARCRVGDEEVFAAQVPALDPGARHEIVWTHAFERPGTYSLACRLDALEDLPADNFATTVLQVVEQIPFVLVEGSPAATELQRDAFCVQAALGWIEGETLEAQSVYAPTIITPEQLDATDLSRPRAIVVPGFTSFSDTQVGRLRDFVANGGGLWLALGPRTEIDDFNQLLYADGHGLAPLAVERIENMLPEGTDSETTAAVTLSEVTSEHPATLELASGQPLDLAAVRIERRFRFADASPGTDVSVLLSDTRGEPIAVEKFFGRGRVIIVGVPLKLQWSDLARSQSFVVLVRNWLDYLTQPRATRHNLAPGDPLALQLLHAESREAILTIPSGEELPLTAETLGDGVLFRSSRTSLPGDYTLELGLTGDRIPFHVNRDPAESNLAALTNDEQAQLAGVVDAGRQIDAVEQGVLALHQPVWPTLLGLLLVFLTAELFLAGLIARERFGAAPISETSELQATIDDSVPPPAGAARQQLDDSDHKSVAGRTTFRRAVSST